MMENGIQQDKRRDYQIKKLNEMLDIVKDETAKKRIKEKIKILENNKIVEK